MAAKIETWLTVQAGARITAEGHLRVRTTAGPGAWQTVTLDAATYKTFALAAQELEDELNNDGGAVGVWTVSVAGGDSAVISCTVAFDLQWLDLEAGAYFGYASDVYSSTLFLGSEILVSVLPPLGRLTFTHPMDIDYFVLLPHRHSEDHAARRFGTAYTLRHGQVCRFIISNDEVPGFGEVLNRLMSGTAARVWLDSAVAGTFAWTDAAWKGGRDLALVDPAQQLQLTQWLASDVALYRRLELRMVEAG